MQQSKKHHYVPVFYLKRWCNQDGQVQVIRNIQGKVARSSRAPNYLNFELHLYSYAQSFDASDHAEIESKFYMPLDNEGARIVSKMVEGRPLDKRDKILWTQFLMAMRVRTPENVARIRSALEGGLLREMELAQHDYQKLRDDSDPLTAVDWLQVMRPGLLESLGVCQLPKISSDPEVMQEIASFEWHVLNLGGSSRPLLTSDRPCVYTTGIDHRDCVIALPLSPTYASFAFRPDSKAKRALMKTPISRVAGALNRSVVTQAYSRAYSRRVLDGPDSFFQRYLAPADST